MYWRMVGCSHHRTPIEIREKLAFSPEQVRQALDLYGQCFPESESVLLSTCNRVELYTATQTEDKLPSSQQLVEFLADFHHLKFDELEDQLAVVENKDVIKHLFMVASSLDSMILGEAQILSQVKTAYEIACEGSLAGGLMHGAFQRATVVARRITNETEIHRRRISVPSVAVSEIATEFFERFDDKRILLIGAGDMGTETLKYLTDAGAKQIQIVNRNQERANELAKPFQAKVSPWEELDACVSEADLVVSTTSSTEPIYSLERFKQVLQKRRRRAILILDLAVPRDFDARITDLPDVYVFTVDDLQRVCDRNIEMRQKEMPKAERIVLEETDKFVVEMVHRGSGPTIKLLREQAEKIKQEELQRLLGRLQASSFERLVNKLLHPPLQSLRENADSSHHGLLLDALRRLFQLRD
jgi:glutamyl-tRNA reductase